MRHVVIREGKNIKNTILSILTSDKGEFPLEELWEELKDVVQGITWSHNLSPADRSYGEIQKSIGQDYLLESLNKIKFKIPVQSFFQTNTKQAERLIQIITEFANLKGDEKVFDLYSGTGSIGLSLAKKAKEIIGIEENEAATKLSLENAELNGMENFSAIAGRVEDVIKSLDLKSDKIILDPPRPGIHKKVLQKIVEAKPKEIVYISCNPNTQREDINLFLEGGYHIKKIQPIDMFPHTPHIENVVLLKHLASM
ncbi:23S rRNA (uracil-5-)-methyltransferase RumA [candidate division WOR-1 bacterium RIFOXYA2_FULL_37_7]|nr:MAG: 23S rRNA (uracil-5-)-methyltransferase RumA [candidate division WOR-1 bacterium RIFOXYA2_FULL_37_7]